jgi:hypothetical protein
MLQESRNACYRTFAMSSPIQELFEQTPGTERRYAVAVPVRHIPSGPLSADAGQKKKRWGVGATR